MMSADDFYRRMRELASKMAAQVGKAPPAMIVLAAVDVAVRVHRIQGYGQREALLALRDEIDALIASCKTQKLPEPSEPSGLSKKLKH